MRLDPFPGPLGADVLEVDLPNIGDREFEQLYNGWLDRGVLRIRSQSLDDTELQEFSRRFGPLEEIPVLLSEAERSELPNLYVTVISNILIDGKPIGGLANKEAAWHSDMTYIPAPPPASILHAIEVPEQGGDTQFACQQAALEVMPDKLRREIATKSIRHDATHNSIGGLRRGFSKPDDLRENPGAAHPIVLNHPETGRDALFLGRRDFAYVVGMPIEESERLLDEVWQYAALPENVLTQKWKVGDVIIWDNRRVLHRRDDFPADSRRLMKRCQVLAR